MRRLALLLVAAIAGAALLPAAAAAANASLPDIEDEVMCVECGTVLSVSNSPVDSVEREFIREQIAAGKNKAEIKQALVAEYGGEVLALPPDSGFSLSAYVVPIVAFLIAALALALGVWRWRRAGGQKDDEGPHAAGPSGADADRLDADLARYDL